MLEHASSMKIKLAGIYNVGGKWWSCHFNLIKEVSSRSWHLSKDLK